MTPAYSTKGASIRITDQLLDRAATVLQQYGNPNELVVRDTDLKGFVLRLRASGRHTFAVAYKRGKLLTLGGTDRLTTGKARKAARDALAETSLDGAPVRAERKRQALTLGAFLDEQYEPWATEHLSTPEETLARLRVNFADLLDTRIADLTPFAIERWRTARLKARKQKATINRDVGALKAAIAKAVAWGYLKAHPIASVKPFTLDNNGVVRYLTADEETRLLAALDARDEIRRRERESANTWRRERGYPEWRPYGTYSDHVTPIVVTALHTGLRRGELFSLTWADVDLTRKVLTVRAEHAKSRRTRHVPLNATALHALTIWRQQHESAGASDLVFPGTDGARLEDIKKAWATITKAAKVKAFRFHDCRHTFASKLVQAGIDLNTVRELLGHGDIKMTLRYSHLAPELKAAAVAKLVSA